MAREMSQTAAGTRESCFLNSPPRHIHERISQNAALCAHPPRPDPTFELSAIPATAEGGWSLPAETGWTSVRSRPPLPDGGRPVHCDSYGDRFSDICEPQVSRNARLSVTRAPFVRRQ